jgi:D-alanyl-lipoteichoic acid acyltransferase DltB (MBOAT superfamily)
MLLCLGVLFVFKYFNFVSESLTSLLGAFSIRLHPTTLNLLLPVGISFYTFQTLSYVIDVYRGEVKAEHHFGYYAVFISFFPQLVAGPIERTRNLLPQIKAEHKFDYDQAAYGLKLMVWGFFKKLAIADVLSTYVDTAYSSLDNCTGFDLLMAIFFFTIQIYCDFSGYSDIAIGTAKLLGINLMKNFNSPYFSTSIKEFWSRWHISLSTWFKDYIYIPLGGNRCSKIKRDRNLMITFLASGLWHGASWTYVIWGALHGVVQVIENHVTTPRKSKISKFIAWMGVFAFCNLAWVFFRAVSFSDAFTVLINAIGGLRNPGSYFHTSIGLGLDILIIIFAKLLILFAYDYASLKSDVIAWIGNRNVVLRWLLYVAFVYLVLMNVKTNNETAFIYFQF